MPIDDPVEVKEQYACEHNLRARQALWQGATGTDPKEVLWQTIEEWQPKRLLEVGGGQGELAERIQSRARRERDVPRPVAADGRAGAGAWHRRASGRRAGAPVRRRHVRHRRRGVDALSRPRRRSGARRVRARPRPWRRADRGHELRRPHRGAARAGAAPRQLGSATVQPRERRGVPPAAFHVDRAATTPTWRCSSRAATRSSRIATRLQCRRSEVPEDVPAAVHRARHGHRSSSRRR